MSFEQFRLDHPNYYVTGDGNSKSPYSLYTSFAEYEEWIRRKNQKEMEEERKRLQDLQSNHQRWFSQEEFDRLTELNRILFEEEFNNKNK